MKELYYTMHGRREFLRAAGYGIALSALPRISFASNSNPDVVVIGAGAAGLSAMAELMRKVNLLFVLKR